MSTAAIRPYVPLFPLHASDLFSVRYNGKKHELTNWEKTAIVITAVAGIFLAGVGVLLGFCLSHYFRNRLVDQLITQSVVPDPDCHFYFDADHFEGTDKETIAPVGATELFYQQKQIDRCCSIHSLCNFAGRNIEGLVPTIIKANNDYWENRYKKNPYREEELEGMKRMGIYIESLQSIHRHGMLTTDVERYMNQNKTQLHLPESCTIRFLSNLIDSDEMKNAIQTIQANPSLHRVIISLASNDFRHSIAIRKDATGQWRTLDSMQSHFRHKTDLQPSFPTLQEAIQNITARYHGQNQGINLLYPSEDTLENVQ